MRPRIGAVIAVLLGSAPAGAAEFSPVFVVPGKPGVPVIINGWDASYTVVEGDFGLDRPNQVNPVIVGNPLIAPVPTPYSAYYPRAGHRPGYGRFEVEPPPNRRLPPPAPSYHRYWQSGSQPLPATLDPPAHPPDVSVNINDENANGTDQSSMGGGGNQNTIKDHKQTRGDKDLRRRDLRKHRRDIRRLRRDVRQHRRDGGRSYHR
jgi:hypothetical protein